MTPELLIELQEIETAVQAYDCNWYDNFDLDYIEERYEEYKEKLESYRSELPNGVLYFSHSKVEDNKLVFIGVFVWSPLMDKDKNHV